MFWWWWDLIGIAYMTLQLTPPKRLGNMKGHVMFSDAKIKLSTFGVKMLKNSERILQIHGHADIYIL